PLLPPSRSCESLEVLVGRGVLRCVAALAGEGEVFLRVRAASREGGHVVYVPGPLARTLVQRACAVAVVASCAVSGDERASPRFWAVDACDCGGQKISSPSSNGSHHSVAGSPWVLRSYRAMAAMAVSSNCSAADTIAVCHRGSGKSRMTHNG